MTEPYESLRELSWAVGDAAAGGDLAAALRERRDAVEVSALRYTLRCMLGFLCELTGDTPRSVLETEFINAPSDEFWRAAVSGRRD